MVDLTDGVDDDDDDDAEIDSAVVVGDCTERGEGTKG